jgi:lantibiotic transport system ATP-binding protein
MIEAKELSYKYRNDQLILNTINLFVPTGSIYGFIGPNGAGKTTTLKLILGLLKKQSGEIKIFNKIFDQNRVHILQKVGALIESPSIYSHLSASENLLIWQKIYNCPIERIQEVLRLVRLSDTGKKKAGQFSLGMQQRLGIAIALLNDPSLLILDEPTNGLDPNGIIEIRELLRSLNKEQGITILISSHLLAEIEKLITHVGILHEGKMMFEGTLEALKKKQADLSSGFLKTSNDIKAYDLLSSQAGLKKLDAGLEVTVSSKEELASLVRLLVNNGIDVYEVRSKSSDLESIFMNVINQ